MSEERKQVLEMLSDGKITVEDAERLLEKLGSAKSQGAAEAGDPGASDTQRASATGPGSAPGGDPRGDEDPGAGDTFGAKEGSGIGRTGKPKYLRVRVDAADGDVVNIRVPLALIRTGIKLSTMIPSETNKKLAERGIDLSQLSGLDGDEMVEALRELNVEVDASSGDRVRVFCE